MLKKIHCTSGNGKSSLKRSMKPWTKPYVHGTFSGCCPGCVTGNDFLLDSQVMISAKGKLMREGNEID